MTSGEPSADHSEGELARALDEAGSTLAARDLSRARLGERLRRRGVEPAVAAQTLDVLARAGLLDDERLAGRRAEVLAGRGLGDAAVRARLVQEGLDPGLADAAVADLEPERERARRLAERERRRGAVGVARLLTRRGFSEEAAESALAVLSAPSGADAAVAPLDAPDGARLG